MNLMHYFTRGKLSVAITVIAMLPVSHLYGQVGSKELRQKSSSNIITEAYQIGKIDREHYLLYQMMAIFSPHVLPSNFQSNVREGPTRNLTMLLLEIRLNWDTLSKSTQNVLSPFLLRPTDPAYNVGLEWYSDVNGDGVYNVGEPYIDQNGNGIYDANVNMSYTVSEATPFNTTHFAIHYVNSEDPFTDSNGDGQWNPAEPYWDQNLNGNYDPAEPFTDTNGNGIHDPGEPYNDLNGNGQYDPSEQFLDMGNGIYDPGEPYNDLNGNGQYDCLESYTDVGNGTYDPAEPYTDQNGNGQYDSDAPSLNDSDSDGVPDFVENMGAEFENVFNIECGASPNMNYDTPPGDGTLGGDARFDVYIKNIGVYGVYGWADPEASSSDNSWYSFMVMDDDYSSNEFACHTPTENKQVTAAHEFHHAVQFGYNVNTSPWYKEATSTWIEDEVYDNINDNWQYMQPWFDSPETSLDYNPNPRHTHKYGSWIWNRYLSEKIDRDIIRNIWEQCKTQNNPLPAISTVLGNQSPSTRLSEEFSFFTAKNYSKTWYEEGSNYPDIKIENNSSPHNSYPVTLQSTTINHLASKYYEFVPDPSISEKRSVEILFYGPDLRDCGAMLIARHVNGTMTEYQINLDSDNDGKQTVTNFGSGAIESIVLAISNGTQSDNNLQFSYEAKYIGGVDIALVLDRSGSMLDDNKIVNAKTAASTFVGFMQNGDAVGVISFNQAARVDFSLTTIVSKATQTAAQNAINNIFAGGATSIGGGMVFGQSELNKGDPNHPHAMLLLSDGLENEPPFVADVLPTIPQATDIYTIGLGTDADQGLLIEIADKTGGTYNFAPNSDMLQEIYLRIQGKITGQQTLVTYNGTIQQGVTETHPVTVDALTSLARFSLIFQGSDVDLELIAPNGSVIDPQIAASDPSITYTEGATFDFYTISSPESGQWSLKIIGVDVPAPEPYSAIVQVSSSLDMEATLDKSQYNTGDPILVKAKLSENGQPILGATVTSDAELPSSSTLAYRISRYRLNGEKEGDVASNSHETNSMQEPISNYDGSNQTHLTFISSTFTLHDDGLHGDGAANDGVYANYFTNTVNDGSYTFTINASGTALQGGLFMRESTISTFVNPSTAPAIVSISPNQGQQGETLDMTINGANFVNGTTVSFSGTGIVVNSVAVTSANEITVNITIASDAVVGLRDVTVTNPDGQLGTAPGIFTVISCGGAASFFDDFEDGNADGWIPNDPSKWNVQSSGNNFIYCLHKANEQGDEYSLLPTKWQDFVLELDARATGNKKIFIIFGVQSFTNSTDTCYYLKFSIGKVELFQAVNGQGVVIASTTDDFVSDGNFHHMKIERQFPNISVTVDGQFLFSVDDNTFTEGYIGVGSRKSRACFDNVSVAVSDCPTATLATITIPKGLQVPAGSRLTVPVIVSTQKIIGLAQFTIEYNDTVLEFDQATIGTDAPGFAVSQLRRNPPFAPTTPGTNNNFIVQISGGGTNSFSGNDKVVVLLDFNATGNVGDTTPLAIDTDCSHTFLTTTDFDDLCGNQITVSNGDATIISAVEISGHVLYYYDSRPVINSSVTLTGATQFTQVTDANGFYQFSNIAPDNYTLTPSKNDDYRAAIKGSDALLLMRYLAFLDTLSNEQLTAADVTQSGTITGSDVVAILRFLAFFTSNIAETGDWIFVPPSVSVNIPPSSTQDFQAFLLGDVTGDWGMTMATNQLAKLNKSEGALILERVSVAGSPDVRVPVTLQSSHHSIHSLLFSIAFDTSQVHLKAVENNAALKDDMIVVNDTEPGKLHIAAVGLQPIPSHHAILNLAFEVQNKQPGVNEGDFIPITFSRAQLNDENVAWVDGGIELTAVTAKIPDRFELLQNYPNPFNLATTIRFGVPQVPLGVTHIILDIYNVNGQKVKRLVDEEKPPGYYSIPWDGRDNNGRVVSTGIYFYTFRAEKVQFSQKLLLIK